LRWTLSVDTLTKAAWASSDPTTEPVKTALAPMCGSESGRNVVTDRGEKLVFYKRLPTLRHIVSIYQDRMCVEHFQRIDDELMLDAVGFTISLAQVYFAIDLSIVRRIRWRGQG
jgi:hypothetical protein